MLQSCATVLSGTKDQISFKSHPPDATILLNGKEIGKTDNSIIIKRMKGSNAMITFHKDGYNDLTFRYETKLNGAYWGSAACYLLGIIPGLVFCVIDMSTGAAYKAKYDTYEKTLIPIDNTTNNVKTEQKSEINNQTKSSNFMIGDNVSFKNEKGEYHDGKIVGINQTIALVQYKTTTGEVLQCEVEISKLFRLQ